jgi:predicted nucleic acid-binding protein
MVRGASAAYTSAWTIAEVTCVFHRHQREGTLNSRTAREVHDQFQQDLRDETWLLIPVTGAILRQVELAVRTLPKQVFLRAGDAVHIVSAADAGFSEIWTNDRHLLSAAPQFGLKGRSAL